MKITIIIPTYNEARTIDLLIQTLEKEVAPIRSHKINILIVDGNSTDGTREIVEKNIVKFNNIFLLKETKKGGLGTAYITGTNYAYKVLASDAFLEFDGDFQHDPKDIKRLVDEMDRGYDYVIGSRYVAGGQIPASWPWYRKLLSRGGSAFIKFILKLPTNDNTSGFKLTRTKNFIDKLPLKEGQIISRRHAYKVHLLYAMVKSGAKIKEIPINFLDREFGNSKSTFEDILETLKVLFVLKKKELWD